MKIKVVGVKKVDYYSQKNQKQVVGKELHFIHLDYESDALGGNVVGTQFISESSPVYGCDIVIGETYTMYKDGYRVDYFAPCLD